MKIISSILDAYLSDQPTAPFRNSWIFETIGQGELAGKNAYTPPPEQSEYRTAVERISEEIRNTVTSFLPGNIMIWNALFPNWGDILSEVDVHLIVGLPEPYDATVLTSPEGKQQVILDLGCWVKYEGKTSLSSLVHNLLTHELFHVCIGKTYPAIIQAEEAGTYLARLDAITFNEGFAHLVSYKDMPLEKVGWDSKELQNVRQKSVLRLRDALTETETKNQNQNVYDACFGNYYDKFACMSGMLYLAECWQKGGIPALKSEFIRGWQGFAARTANIRTISALSSGQNG